MLFGEGPQIKNIAADLNKLFRQGSLLNQIGQTVEGDSTADQGTSDLLAARDPVIQEISVGMSGEQSARYTVSGTPPLTLPNSLGKPLKAWSVDVSPYQEGSGDPAPDNVRPIHGTDKVTIWTGGQNLFQTSAESKTESGVTWTVNSDGTITVSGTATGYTNLNIGTSAIDYHWGTITISGIASATNIVWSSIRLVDDDNTIIYTVTAGSSTPSFTVDLTQYPTATNIVIALKRNNDLEVSGAVMPMVNLGSTALPFTPYIAPSQTVITLPSTVYTATIGAEGGESRWEIADLGDFTWTRATTTEGEPYPYRWATQAQAIPCSGTVSEINCISDHYKAVSYIQLLHGDANNICSCEVRGYINVVNSALDELTPSQVKSALSGVKLLYRLATPTTFSVPSVTIPTPTGTATTWATAEDGQVDSMSVTYVGKA